MISRDPLVTLTVTLLIVMPLFFFTQSKNQAEDRELTVLNQRLNKLEQQLKNLDPLPSFDEVDSIAERKQLFFAYFNKVALLEGAKIQAHRRVLLQSINEINNPGISEERIAYLYYLAELYGMPVSKEEGAADSLATQRLLDIDFLTELKRRVDVIPPSLLLVQAAIESAWGTSRFSTEANNYFGQWCFSQGCGLIPRQRSKGSSHEVRRFASPYESVSEYMRNLNSHRAYSDFRRQRALAREQGVPLSGRQLASELKRYSELGEAYVRLLRSMIASNNLQALDEHYQRDLLLVGT